MFYFYADTGIVLDDNSQMRKVNSHVVRADPVVGIDDTVQDTSTNLAQKEMTHNQTPSQCSFYAFNIKHSVFITSSSDQRVLPTKPRSRIFLGLSGKCNMSIPYSKSRKIKNKQTRKKLLYRSRLIELIYFIKTAMEVIR